MNPHLEHKLEEFLPTACTLPRLVDVEVKYTQRLQLMVVAIAVVDKQFLLADS